MRVIVSLLVITALLIPFSYTYAQSAGELGYRLVPSKIIEGTEGILQVYVKDSLPSLIENLVVTSSNPSIVEVVSVEQDQESRHTEVRVKALGVGNTKIALAAPGFLPREISITTYPNVNTATQLLMKITPDVFSVNSPDVGYVSVQLANKDGVPVFATEDVVIDLNTPNDDILKIKESSIVIKKGDYFSIGQFEVKQSGDANLFASSEHLGGASGKISVSSKASELRIQSYIYPELINNYFSSFGYLVVQLQDASGNPVIAKKDIPISVQITDPSQTESVNTSERVEVVRPVGQLVIKEGTYWGFIQLAVKAGLNVKYDVTISAKDYLIPESAQLETTLTYTRDDKSAKIDLLPILATGKKELIGILHLEDPNGSPVISRDDLTVKVDSSDLKTLSVENVHLNRGDTVALVFGRAEKTGNPVTLTVITEEPQTLTPLIVMPTEEDQLSLVVQPLVQKVLSGTTFPMALYLSHPEGNPEYSTIEANLLITPKESIELESKRLLMGQGVTVLDSKLMNDESTTLSFMAGQYSATSAIDVFSYGPSTTSLNYPDKIIRNTDNVFAIELLDDQNLPTFADRDIEIRLVSNEQSLQIPQKIVIPKGSYYSLFNAIATAPGNAKISVLTNGMPLSEFGVTATAFSPQLSLATKDTVNPDSVFTAMINAEFNSKPISGLKVNWDVKGARIQSVESTTGEDGTATVSLLSPETGKIEVDATVSGGPFMDTTAHKDIPINITQIVQEPQKQPEFFDILGVDPIYFVIPAGAAGAVFVLKRRGYLEGINERFNFFTEMKEKILQVRER